MLPYIPLLRTLLRPCLLVYNCNGRETHGFVPAIVPLTMSGGEEDAKFRRRSLKSPRNGDAVPCYKLQISGRRIRLLVIAYSLGHDISSILMPHKGVSFYIKNKHV